MSEYIPLEVLEDNIIDQPIIDIRWITPIQLFKKYFSDKFLNEIVKFTNEYAHTKITKSILKKHSRYRNWKELSLKEFKVFIALIINFGIHRNRKISDNWSRNPLLSTSISRYMSYNRFNLINSMLHLSESNHKGYDKVRILLKRFNLVSPRLLKLGKYLTIDENLYPFKGRFRLRQYIKNKPKKYGLKFYLLCSSSGFCYRLKPYETKEDNIQLVKSLIDPFEMQKRILLMDNWYTTFDLANYLTKNRIGFIGTLRENRILNKDLKNIKLEKNEYKVTFNKSNPHLMLTSIRDKRLFHMLSNCHKIGQNELFPLSIVQKYNLHSKGVDRNNQLCMSYRFQHRSKKWWKKVFFYILEIVTTNCYFFYKHKTEDLSHQEFNISIIESLIKNK